MNRKNLLSVALICVMFVGVISFLDSKEASAAGSGWIGSGTGAYIDWGESVGNCTAAEDYMLYAYCAGFSWIYYKADTPTYSDVSFSPFGYVGSSNEGDAAKIDSECSNNGNGGFWHYGINAQADYTGRFLFGRTTKRYSSVAGKWGHWTSYTRNLQGSAKNYAPGVAGAASAFALTHDYNACGLPEECLNHQILDGSGNRLYYATDYAAGYNDVLPEFRKAYDRLNGEGAAERDGINSIPPDTWAFCYWEDDYLGSSSGFAVDGSGKKITAATEIVDKDSETIVDSSPIVFYETNVAVDLNFAHNVYAKESGHEAWWRVSEIWFDANKSTGKAENFTIGNSEVTTNKVKFGNKKEKGYYVPDGDPVANPVVSTETPVTFTKGGTYVFCQDLRVADTEEKMAEAKVTSEACLVIEVSSGYFGMSSASAAGGGSTKTAIVPMGSETTAPDASAEVLAFGAGDWDSRTVKLTFAHNVYSDSPSGKVYWGIDRNDDLVEKGQVGSGPIVFSRLPSYYAPSSELEFKTQVDTASGLYLHKNVNTKYCEIYYGDICNWGYWYGGEDVPPNVPIGYPINNELDNGAYVNRETINVVFEEGDAGKEFRFCERLYISENKDTLESRVDGGPGFTSEACIVMKITEITPEGLKGFTYVWSRIINDRLTGDYAGLKGVPNDPNPVEHDSTGEDGNVVWARPDDTINWVDDYSPEAQVNYGKQVMYINGDLKGGHGEHPSCSFTANTYVPMGTKGYGDWNNNYSITATYPGGPQEFFRLGLGSTSLRRKTHSYEVLVGDVGKTYDDLIMTEDNTPHSSDYREEKPHDWYITCVVGYTSEGKPIRRSVHRRHTNMQKYGSYVSSETIDDAEQKQLRSKTFLKIPYNFVNESGFKIDRTTTEHDPVYSGETLVVSGTFVTVGTKENSVVESTYATKVDGARVVLIAYVSEEDQVSGEDEAVVTTVASAGGGGDDLCNFVSDAIVYSGFCETVNEAAGTLTVPAGMTDFGFTHGNNEDGTIMGTAFNGTYDVFDARAGDWFCMTLGVYPATSGEPKNMEAKGDDSWLLYTPKCIQIAKKPSFQVWGSGLYSAAKESATRGVSISTNVSEKNNIYKVHVYTSKSNNATIFGSWVEENVTTLGSVQWLASGAGLGKNDKETKGGYSAASMDGVFCDHMVSLSFANYNYGFDDGEGGFLGLICPLNQVSGYAGIRATAFDAATNPGALAEYWDSGEPDGADIDAGDLAGAGTSLISATSKDVRTIYTTGNVTIGESQLAENQTRIIRARNVTISGNIKYDEEKHSTLNNLSKVVIYATNINISCTVNRVDAVLIAADTVDTCSDDSGEIDDNLRSNQLVINGTVIARNLVLDRTYGNTLGISNGGYISPSIPGSETPAEIINYDTSLLIWGASMAGAGESNTLTVTYQHELAPRY
ncbi:hypothetical protein IKT18_03285 [Candidatus Saccharibacteria bacterium]|nr:hypothetical protein [Candidatus Saccharibacteria bacterium]